MSTVRRAQRGVLLLSRIPADSCSPHQIRLTVLMRRMPLTAGNDRGSRSVAYWPSGASDGRPAHLIACKGLLNAFRMTLTRSQWQSIDPSDFIVLFTMKTNMKVNIGQKDLVIRFDLIQMVRTKKAKKMLNGRAVHQLHRKPADRRALSAEAPATI